MLFFRRLMPRVGDVFDLMTDALKLAKRIESNTTKNVTVRSEWLKKRDPEKRSVPVQTSSTSDPSKAPTNALVSLTSTTVASVSLQQSASSTAPTIEHNNRNAPNALSLQVMGQLYATNTPRRHIIYYTLSIENKELASFRNLYSGFLLQPLSGDAILLLDKQLSMLCTSEEPLAHDERNGQKIKLFILKNRCLIDFAQSVLILDIYGINHSPHKSLTGIATMLTLLLLCFDSIHCIVPSNERKLIRLLPRGASILVSNNHATTNLLLALLGSLDYE